jgi:uncharacterized protein YdhG (YjbR/CyaY superfamily)
MMSKASTVSEYLADLSPADRADIRKVRSVIVKNLPKGYKEAVQWGMICYAVPLSRYPDTYNGQPLCYAALAAQKNYHSLYLMNVYSTKAEEQEFRTRYEASGRKLDMGKSCVRFRAADDLPLDLIGKVIAKTPVDEFIANYEKARSGVKQTKKKATKKR